MNYGEVKTIRQMAEDAIKNKVFDDVCEELEYQCGYLKGARQALNKVSEFINNNNSVDVGQINNFINNLLCTSDEK